MFFPAGQVDGLWITLFFDMGLWITLTCMSRRPTLLVNWPYIDKMTLADILCSYSLGAACLSTNFPYIASTQAKRGLSQAREGHTKSWFDTAHREQERVAGVKLALHRMGSSVGALRWSIRGRGVCTSRRKRKTSIIEP
jgi:hypothetical protein